MAEPIAFAVDHFIYRAGTGRAKCSRCDAAITPGETVRVPADLNDNGWWHETCPVEATHSSVNNSQPGTK